MSPERPAVTIHGADGATTVTQSDLASILDLVRRARRAVLAGLPRQGSTSNTMQVAKDAETEVQHGARKREGLT
jgi:hypothetical protein